MLVTLLPLLTFQVPGQRQVVEEERRGSAPALPPSADPATSIEGFLAMPWPWVGPSEEEIPMSGGGSRGREVKEMEEGRRRRCRRQEVLGEAGASLGKDDKKRKEKETGQPVCCA